MTDQQRREMYRFRDVQVAKHDTAMAQGAKTAVYALIALLIGISAAYWLAVTPMCGNCGGL